MAQAATVVPKNHLGGEFYSMPRYANTTMTTKQVKETLLATDGWIMARGQGWTIVSKRIGPGVYEVFLKERNA